MEYDKYEAARVIVDKIVDLQNHKANVLRKLDKSAVLVLEVDRDESVELLMPDSSISTAYVEATVKYYLTLVDEQIAGLQNKFEQL